MISRLPTYRFLGRSACALGVLLLIVFTWNSYQVLAAQQVREGWVRHTYVVLDKLTETESSMRSVLATSRGNLLAPGPRFLELLKMGVEDVRRQMGEIQTLTADNSDHREPVSSLIRACERVLAAVDKCAGSGRPEDRTNDPAFVAHIESSRDEMDAFLVIQRGIIFSEKLLLKERLANANEQLQWSKKWVIGMGCGALVTLLGALALHERQLFLRSQLERTLENRVDERTRELALANHDLESFSYSVAHDLKSPMRAIEGFATLGQRKLDKGLKDAAMTYFEKISIQAVRTSQMIESLLIFSQIGRTALSTVPVDFGRLTRGVWADLEIERDQRGSTSSLIIDGEMPIVLGEEPLLHQVVQNLITNAIKYSAIKPGSTITVGCRQEVPPELSKHGPRPSPGDQVQHIFFVRDQGIGFNMSDYSRLFSVFQRLHTDHADGSGVGLAICKRIVERHGGYIWATSILGEGTEVCFTLPVFLKQRSDRTSQRVDAAPHKSKMDAVEKERRVTV